MIASAQWNRTGVTREVFLIGAYAIKIPSLRSWRMFLHGLLCNMQERLWSGAGPEFCPVTFALPGGWLLVMRRARELTDEEWAAFDPQGYEHALAGARGVTPWLDQLADYIVPAEIKQDSFGWLNGRIVAIDYGS
jgi:hypothetical protein